jgi:hypothetical protein
MGFSRLCIAERRGTGNSTGRGLLLTGLLGLAFVVGGCSANSNSNIKDDPPANASVVRETKDHFEFLVNNPGRVVIYDITAKRTLYAQVVKVGDNVVFDADQQLISVNGRVVNQPTVVADHVYQLYWDGLFAKPEHSTD